MSLTRTTGVICFLLHVGLLALVSDGVTAIASDGRGDASTGGRGESVFRSFDRAVPQEEVPHEGISREIHVDSPAAAKAALQKAKPGDTVVLADGVYRDAGLWIGRSGTAEAPLVVRARTPGKVTFTGNMRILLACRHVVVDGFTFDQVWSSSAIVRFDSAEFCRFTNCAFVECGDPKSSRGRTIDLTRGSKHNRIDHCYMQGNLSQGMGMLVGQESESLPTHNQFDHNYFKDIPKRSPNGQEAIQLGQGGAPDGSALEAVVEWNLFDNASGDAEVISVKAHHNTIRYNTFHNCNAELTLRGGFYAHVEGNSFYNNRGGIRVFGTGHVIVNNYIEGSRLNGIQLPTGGGGLRGKPLDHYREARDCLIAHNTIVNCGEMALAVGVRNNHFAIAEHRKPADNTVLNNIVVGNKGLLVLDQGERSTWAGNLIWATGDAARGTAVDGVRALDPLLTRAERCLRLPSVGSPSVDAGSPLPPEFSDSPLLVDFDGQGRDDKPDVGCDELTRAPITRRPLQPADVGPVWMKGDPSVIQRIASPQPIPFIN